MIHGTVRLVAILAASFVMSSSAFSVVPSRNVLGSSPASSTRRFLFDKVFEESGPLGKGITVGKVQVCLSSMDRSDSSIFGALDAAIKKSGSGSTQYDLAVLAQDVCLALLRRKDSWTAAASDSQWFREADAGAAEGLCNEWCNREAVKFEKEYPAAKSSEGGPTSVVISMVLEIVGDVTNFQGAGLSFGQTQDVLQSIASDVVVEDGDFLNAVEVFWTPGSPEESLTPRDLVLDFPELMTL